MNVLQIWWRSLVLVALVFQAVVFASAATAAQPNVLLILVDDLKPAIRCYGDETAITPNIDRLAASGIRFERAYCNQAVCAPSRFTLLLGSHSTNTGLYGLGSHLRQAVPDAVTLPQHFARHGYRTESLGKVFHIGHGNLGDPESFSVPHWKDKVIEYLDPKSTDGGLLTREEALFTNQQLDKIRSLPRGAAFESPDVGDTAYADGRVAMETIERLRKAKQRLENDQTPFFIAAGFVRPHLPFSAPKKYWDLYDSAKLPLPPVTGFPENAPQVALKRGGEITAYKPVPESVDIDVELARKLIHGYYASTSYVDAQIGKVLDALGELALDENTVVVLWGDHGFHLGDLGIWTKHTNYEQANRIPIIIRAPGFTTPNSVSGQLMESVDIYPTLAELCDLPLPSGPQPIDGVSMVPVLKEPGIRIRDHAYHVYPKRKLGRAIRTERYRLVEWSTENENDIELELYDYQMDPYETKNVAEERPEIVNALREILADYPEPIERREDRNVRPDIGADRIQVELSDIANKEFSIEVEIEEVDQAFDGVVLAQGGREHGYALYFRKGIPHFDIRVNGRVASVQGNGVFSGTVQLKARYTAESATLTVNDLEQLSIPSLGLIPVQPKDGLSVGFDDRTAAGNYEAPFPFNGRIVSGMIAALSVQ